MYLELSATNADTTHLEVVAEIASHNRRSLESEVLDLLAQGVVLTRAKLRDALAVKNERLGGVLESLRAKRRIRRTSAGWQRIN